MREPYEDYKELEIPMSKSKESIFKKASKFIGNVGKQKSIYKTGRSTRKSDIDDADAIDSDYLDPFESHVKDELRKKKSSKAKPKRKVTKKCKCN